MINTRKLKARIIEQGFTQETLAPVIGMSASTLGRKIKNSADMTLREVEVICEALDIPREKILEYFMLSDER